MKRTELSERIFHIDNKKAVTDKDKTAEYLSHGVRVKVTYPDNVKDTIRQQKINRLYDILCMKNTESEESTAHLPKVQ